VGELRVSKVRQDGDSYRLPVRLLAGLAWILE